MIQSGPLDELWDCVMECYCSLRNVHGKMADGNTEYEKMLCVKLEGPLIPL